MLYIPLISRVRGPYGKLWTEFFPSFYGPSAKRASHENKEGKQRGSIFCCTDRANEANNMFNIGLCRLFRFWKGDRELEVRTAIYRPGIDQWQHAKSVSHIIINHLKTVPYHTVPCNTIPCHFILLHAIIYRIISYHTIPYQSCHTVPYYSIPYHTVPYYTKPCHTWPHLAIPYYTILYNAISYLTVLYSTTLYKRILEIN